MDVLKVIKAAMTALGMNYAYMEYTETPTYPYWVGELQETEPPDEDGLQEKTFILTGFSRETWLYLENARETIENYFDPIEGHIVTTESNNNVVAIFYGNSVRIPTGDSELKKIEIYLTVKEWKVN